MEDAGAHSRGGLARLIPRRRRGDDQDEARDLTRASLPSVMFGGTGPLGGAPPVSIRQALALPDVQACVRAFAGVFALVELQAVRPAAGDGMPPPVAADTLAARLLARPEDGLGGSAWRGRLGAHLCLYGEAFIGLARDETGEVAALPLLDPSRVDVKVVKGRREFAVSDGQGRPQRLTTGDVLHVMAVSLDGVRGLSPVKSAPLGFQLARAVAEHAVRSFSSGGRVSTVVTVKGAGSGAGDVIENLARDLRASPDSIAVVDGDGVGVAALGSTNRDSELVTAGHWGAQLIAKTMGVPFSVVGESAGGSLTYSNVQSELQALAGLHLRPFLQATVDALNLCQELFPQPAVRARWDLAATPLDPQRGFGAAPAPGGVPTP